MKGNREEGSDGMGSVEESVEEKRREWLGWKPLGDDGRTVYRDAFESRETPQGNLLVFRKSALPEGTGIAVAEFEREYLCDGAGLQKLGSRQAYKGVRV